MIVLHGFPLTRSWRVSWVLEELGLKWQYEFVNLRDAQQKTAQYQSLNPRRRIPTLVDGDVVITESASAALFLAEKYGNGRLLPQPGSAESARHHQWISLIISEIEQPLWNMGKHRFALPESQRVKQMPEVAQWEFAKIMAEIEGDLPENGFLVGNTLSVADILLAQTLNWAKRFEQPLSAKAEAYRARLSERPAAQQALALEQAGAKQ